MDLKKNLILYYTLSVDVAVAKMKWVEHKKTTPVLKKRKMMELETIQNNIDKYLSAAVAMETWSRLTKQQKKLEVKTVATLKKVKFPKEKVIKFHDDQHGKLSFWHKGGRILFLKEDSDSQVRPMAFGNQ